MSEDVGDSIRAAERVLRSARFRAIAGWAWTILAPFAGAAAGWLISRAQLAARVDAQDAAITKMAESMAKIAGDVEKHRIARQQADKAIGRYTAFAVAASQAYESPKVKQQKVVFAEKYAKAYERQIDEGAPADIAMLNLYKDVALP